jgi:hypothetical protein
MSHTGSIPSLGHQTLGTVARPFAGSDLTRHPRPGPCLDPPPHPRAGHCRSSGGSEPAAVGPLALRASERPPPSSAQLTGLVPAAAIHVPAMSCSASVRSMPHSLQPALRCASAFLPVRLSACAQRLHVTCRYVYNGAVERLNITLDDEQAAKLERLAGRMHVKPGTVARSLLSSALDEADPDARNVADLLDGIPGAFERASLGVKQAQTGETIPLNEL